MFDNKKIIIFDLDGTLIDSLGMWNYVDSDAIKECGGYIGDNVNIKEERDKFFENNVSGNIYLEYEKYLINKYKLNIDIDEFHQFRWDISKRYLKNKMRFKLLAVDFLNLLKSHNYRLVLATTSTKATIDIYMEYNKEMYTKCNFYEMFDLILTRDDVSLKKPNPEIYLKILNDMNVKSEDCLIFEDSLAGVQAGIGSGIDVVCVYDEYAVGEHDKIKKLIKYPICTYEEIINRFNNDLL